MADKPDKASPDYMRGFLDGLREAVKISWSDAFESKSSTRLYINRLIKKLGGEP